MRTPSNEDPSNRTERRMRDNVIRSARPFVLGVSASDAHAVANRLIYLMLTGSGFTVVNLGVCTPLEEFADAQAEHSAAAVLIGSVNGHAVDDLRLLPELRRIGRLDCPVIFGGRPSIEARKYPAARRQLRELGVDYLLSTAAELPSVLDAVLDASGGRARGVQCSMT